MAVSFETNIIGIYREKGRDWLANLPIIVEKIAAKWNLADLTPYENLTYNYVASGKRGAQDIVIKIAPEFKDLRREALALDAFKNHGAVICLEQDEENCAIILERAMPGENLEHFYPFEDETSNIIAANIIKKLHQAPLQNLEIFTPVEELLKSLEQEAEIPEDHLERASTISRKLLQTTENTILLHGDLHHENIISNGNSYLVIDPKGYVGDRYFEVGPFLRNPVNLTDYENVKSIMIKRLEFFSTELNLDKRRILEWCYVQSILSSIWAVEDSIDEEPWLELADLFLSFL